MAGIDTVYQAASKLDPDKDIEDVNRINPNQAAQVKLNAENVTARVDADIETNATDKKVSVNHVRNHDHYSNGKTKSKEEVKVFTMGI